jgi:hypothetical protein
MFLPSTEGTPATLAFLGEQFCYNDIKRLNLRGKKQKK